MKLILNSNEKFPEKLDFPTASPMRIAYFSVLTTGVILLAIYSASLISYLTVSSPTVPFATLTEFARDGSYKLVAFQQSADYDLFAVSDTSLLSNNSISLRFLLSFLLLNKNCTQYIHLKIHFLNALGFSQSSRDAILLQMMKQMREPHNLPKTTMNGFKQVQLLNVFDMLNKMIIAKMQ